MRFLKSLLLGVGIGIVLTVAVLDVWAIRFERKILFSAQPRLLQPFMQYNEARAFATAMQQRLPRPWLPETSSRLHDDWRLRPLDGKPVTLGEFRGKVVFLDFWRTSCGPCIAEMPSIERLYHSLPRERISFVAVTTEEEEKVRDFLKGNKLGVPVYLGERKTPEDLPAAAVPATFILDRSGKAIFEVTGAVDWYSDEARSFLLALATQ